ncbi:hypothetical protein Aperf_G00000093351 [Anoplocephala perfoliata]
MEGTCPLCRNSGVISPLYSISDAFGTVSNLCSNASCPYPLDSYVDLLDSLSQAPSINLLQSSPEFHHMTDTSPEAGVVMSESLQLENGSVTSVHTRSYEQSPPKTNLNPDPPVLLPHVSKPCAILPRYLADSLREADSQSRGFACSSGSDSGISLASRSSNLSYQEMLALRAQRPKSVGESQKPVRPVSLIEKYIKNTA